MFLCAQYYRPPFPTRRYWKDDFKRAADAGLHAVQFWLIWGWVEAKPGTYDFSDYDELVALADKAGLKVVLSSIAEMHPFWIHRVVPDSHLVTHLGHPVISTPRDEVNCAVTPGGCWDHPRVAELMRGFLLATGRHFKDAGNVIGWDCWNELRWNVHADGYTCYCPYSLGKFRDWLDRRHGGLEGLSAAWQRRYVDWEDVRPGKQPFRPFTETIEFQRWLVDRSTSHAKWRYDILREAGVRKPITAHAATPSVQNPGWDTEHPVSRGIDWDLADQLDGFGSSHFPFWGKPLDEEDMGIRLDAIRSACQGKVTWMSEMHGGSARNGIMAHNSVPAKGQQRCVYLGMSRAAKGVVFWSWRDEIFGRESSGFGLSGWDGLAEERLAAMKVTGQFIRENNDLIDKYMPEPAKVGILFNPDNNMLDWADQGSGTRAVEAFNGYARALERLRIPYEVIEAHHLAGLEQVQVLIMPWCLILPDAAREAVVAFLKRGGRVLCEADTDAFTELGFYRYPDERPFMQALGLHDLGRRQIGQDPSLPTEIGERSLDLLAENFVTPLTAGKGAEVLARDERDQPLIVRQPVGQGAAFVVGTFLGRSFWQGKNADLPAFVGHVIRDAGIEPSLDVDAGDGNRTLLWRTGTSGKAHLLWIVNGGPQRTVTVTDRAGLLGRMTQVTELTRGQTLEVTKGDAGKRFTLDVPDGGYAVVKW